MTQPETSDSDRWLWGLEHVLIPLLIVGVLGLFVVLGLNLAGVVGHHGCAR